MRGMSDTLTIGERVAWYRRRRGLSQDVLAGLVGRTTDWLSKAENNRIELDRLSVIQTLADALGVSVGDLLGEPTLVDWGADTGRRALPDLRAALMDYRMLTPLFTLGQQEGEPIGPWDFAKTYPHPWTATSQPGMCGWPTGSPNC